MLKRFIQKILLLVFGVLVAILLVEAGSRLTGIFFEPPSWWMDLQTRIYSIYRPRSVYTLQTEEFQSIRTSNSQGLLDKERIQGKADTEYRILMLGDSFVAGEQMELSSTFSGLLENDPTLLNDLKAKYAQITVINAGISGTGTAEQYIYYRERGLLFQADLVVLCFFLGNDVINNSLELNAANPVNLRRSHFTINAASGHLVEVRGVGRSFEQTLYLRSFLWRTIGGLLRANVSETNNSAPTEGQITTWNNMYLEDLDDPQLEKAYEVTQLLINALQDAVHADGADFKVILIPSKQQVHYQSDILSDNINPLLPNEKLTQILTESVVSYFDSTTVLRDAALQTGQSYYFMNDIHLNPSGHRLVACMLSLFIEQVDPTVEQCMNTSA